MILEIEGILVGGEVDCYKLSEAVGGVILVSPLRKKVKEK